ncbi:MAG: STAS domain-containing protein [Planctomycetota bacterium]|jgi:anti-anti-sigma factor
MGIENISDDIILVVLPKEPDLRRELAEVNETITNKGGRDVIIDFSRVEIVTSSSISNLIILRKTLSKSGHRLFLCEVAFITRCIFRIAGLSSFFDFVDDVPDALADIKGSESTELSAASKAEQQS